MQNLKLHRLFLIILLLISGSSLPISAQANTRIVLPPLSLAPNESGVIHAEIDCAASACSAFGVVIAFDPAVIQVDSLQVGSYMGANVFEAGNEVDNDLGLLTLSAARLGDTAEESSNVLFSIAVTALETGNTPLEIVQFEVTDSTGSPLEFATIPGNVLVMLPDTDLLTAAATLKWRIAFVSERDENPEIYVMDFDGTDVSRLTNHTAADTSPGWSPDGSRIAFVSDRDGNPEIYVMNADGTDVSRLTNHAAADTSPGWSPDGTRIAFVSDRDGNPEIYVMNVDGTNVSRLTNHAAADTSPRWSPDGTRIAFVSDRDGNPEIYVMNADGNAVIRLTEEDAVDGKPAWSPDGTHIVFVSERGSQVELYLMTADGNDTAQLVYPNTHNGEPAWGLDSVWLSFVTESDGNAEIAIARSNGNDSQVISNTAAPDYQPDVVGIAAPCLVRAANDSVQLRVGPGLQRGIYGTMPTDVNIPVLGQTIANDGSGWWQLDISAFDNTTANELWVAQSDTLSSGFCGRVPTSDAPPVIPQVLEQPSQGWGACGSCETCGGPADECVLSPDGICLWDPGTCAAPPQISIPDPGNPGQPGRTCYQLTTSVQAYSGGAGYISVRQGPNCGGRYTPGSSVSLSAVTTAGYFSGWSGTCPGASGNSFSITVTMTGNCSVTATFNQIN